MPVLCDWGIEEVLEVRVYTGTGGKQRGFQQSRAALKNAASLPQPASKSAQDPE